MILLCCFLYNLVLYVLWCIGETNSAEFAVGLVLEMIYIALYFKED